MKTAYTSITMKMKYIFPALLLFVGVGCQSAPPSTKQSDSQQQVVQKLGSPQADQSIVYKDPKYKFSLTLPPEWKNYSVKYREVDWGTFKGDSLDVGLPGDESLFNIAIMTKAQWLVLQADSGIPEKGTWLGEQAGNVFVGASGQSAQPENLVRMKEVSGILKSFELSK